MGPASEPVAALARRLAERLRGLRRRAAMNYSVNFTELTVLLEVVESLAPEFEAAFRIGKAATLRPRGGRRVEGLVAVRALSAAADQQPESWFLRLMLAYYLLADVGDEQAAAVELQRAGEVPEAPAYVRSLARRLGSKRTSDVGGADPQGELRLFRQLAQVQARVDAWRAENGSVPATVDEVLTDPEGLALRGELELELVVSAAGEVTTREHQARSQLAHERAARFKKVRPFVVPEY